MKYEAKDLKLTKLIRIEYRLSYSEELRRGDVELSTTYFVSCLSVKNSLHFLFQIFRLIKSKSNVAFSKVSAFISICTLLSPNIEGPPVPRQTISKLEFPCSEILRSSIISKHLLLGIKQIFQSLIDTFLGEGG